MPYAQENSALRDELTTSKSTILHLIHELNQAKCQQAKPSVSHSSGKLPGEMCMVTQGYVKPNSDSVAWLWGLHNL